MTEKTKTKPKPNGRDSSGRFSKGNRLSPGRPRRDTEREYLAAFQRALSTEDLEAVTRSVFECAMAGNVAACRLLLEYSVGRPTERIRFQPEEEYRVAGISPAEHMQEMLKRIAKQTKERRAYEKEVAAQTKARRK